MNGSDRPWDDMHHHSYFLPEISRIEQDDFRSSLSEIVSNVIVPLVTHDIYAKENMQSISPTVTIDISRIPGKKMYTLVQIVRRRNFDIHQTLQGILRCILLVI
jgi:hypothetical protein